jgi:hypothetical protein
MDLDRTPSEIAIAAAEEIRALNHVTLNPGCDNPAAVHDTAAALQTLAERLPQTLDHLGRQLQNMIEQGRVRLTVDSPGSDTVLERGNETADALKLARINASQLEDALAAVAQLTASLYAPDDSDEQ